MNMGLESVLNEYTYEYPKELIAKEPASPRDSARLLVYDRKSQEIILSDFLHLDEFLPDNAVLVFNETKVIPARLKLTKHTGGAVEVLYLEGVGSTMKVMSTRRLDIGSYLYCAKRKAFKVTRQDEKYYFLEKCFKDGIVEYLNKYGEMPIPPYIKNSPLDRNGLKKKYQTVFARKEGSVAAPTASLHFTERLFRKIRSRGIKICFITLHVNLGTFAPLTEEHLSSGKLHEEYYEISPSVRIELERAKHDGRPIVAVGTTVVRALESAAKSSMALDNPSGVTRLFIRDGYKLKFVDNVITNFHVPGSSLLMLVSAFIGKARLMELYEIAIKNGFKLFSFGDGMLIK